MILKKYAYKQLKKIINKLIECLKILIIINRNLWIEDKEYKLLWNIHKKYYFKIK